MAATKKQLRKLLTVYPGAFVNCRTYQTVSGRSYMEIYLHHQRRGLNGLHYDLRISLAYPPRHSEQETFDKYQRWEREIESEV